MQPTSLPLDEPRVIPLWPEGAIDTTGWDHPEEIFDYSPTLKVIRNVVNPSLTVFLPDPAIATGTAVIVCPGGGFHFLAYGYEGIDVARWLTEHGIAAFMLKYRLVQTGDNFHECMDKNRNDPRKREELITSVSAMTTADGCQAVRLVRERAAEWNLNPNRIGMMGFSAGGFVALSTALNYDASSRPDFAAPIYSAPPIEVPIPADAPPLFLLCAADDDMASDVSTSYYAKWRKAGHPVELHIYAQGGHGFGMNKKGLPSDCWIERFADWLKALGLLG